MAINAILMKVVPGTESEELGMLAAEKYNEGNAADPMFDKC